MGKNLSHWYIAILLTLLTACNAQKEPAEAAFAQIQTSVAAVSADLEQYAPEEYAQLTETVNAMKSKLNAQEYDAVLELRSQAMQRLIAASGVTAARKLQADRQLSGNWASLATAVPDMISKISMRIDDLRDMPQLPNGVSAKGINQAEAMLPSLNATWTAVTALSSKGNMEAAISKAQELQQRCVQIGGTLGLRLL